MDTEYRPIFLELYPKQAPITVKNFLNHIDEKHYNEFYFYQKVTLGNQDTNEIKIEVIQGGLGFGKHPPQIITNKAWKHANYQFKAY